MEFQTINIPKAYAGALESALRATNKKERKTDSPKSTHEIKRYYDREVINPDTGRRYQVPYMEVVVWTQSPIIEGWMFLGKMSDEDGIVQVHSITKDEEIPSEYRNPDFHRCDHCNTRHKRKYLYVVKNIESKETLQVGQSCLKDFIGHGDLLNSLYARIDLLNRLDQLEEDEKGIMQLVKFEDQIIELRIALAMASKVVETNGWISRSKAEYNETPTVDIVQESLYKGMHLQEGYLTDQHFEMADKIISYVREVVSAKESPSEYEWNLSIIFENDVVTFRHLPLACSAIAGFRHYEKRQREKENQGQSEFQGEVGQRFNLNVQMVFHTGFETRYGIQILSKLKDEEGNTYVWFGSRRVEKIEDGILVPLENGEWAQIKATVKAHKEYQGEKQTIIKNVREQ